MASDEFLTVEQILWQRSKAFLCLTVLTINQLLILFIKLHYYEAVYYRHKGVDLIKF